MFEIRTHRADDLTSLAGFLEFKVPGLVVSTGRNLHVIFRGRLDPAAQERLLERLIWAWRVEHGIESRAEVRLSFVPDPTALESTDHALRSRPRR